MPQNKTKATALSVTAYIDALTDPTQRSDAKELIRIMQRASGEKPKLWGSSIVGFGTHHYRYESGREGDMPLICFSPRKAALVLYSLLGNSEAKDPRRNFGNTPQERDASTSRDLLMWIGQSLRS
jgi:hypothetical protein